MTPRKSIRVVGLFFALLALGAAAVALASCGGDDNASKSATATMAATQPAVKAGTLEISNVRIRLSANDTTAIYFVVKNSGPADKLVSASLDPGLAGMVQIHEIVTQGSTSSMQELKGGLPIPANGTVELKPGGFHVMVMNLKKPIAKGDSIPVTLVFEKAGTVSVKATGDDIQGSSPDMGGMGTPAASATMAR